MEVRPVHAPQPGSLRPTAAQSDVNPTDTVEFRRPGWLGIGWRAATPEQAQERLNEGKTVEVREQSQWIPLEQPDDLQELSFFRGTDPQAPSDMGRSLKALAEKGARFHNQTELGPFGAYHELEQGRPIELRLNGRSLELDSAQDVRMAAYFHAAGDPPTLEAQALKQLFDSRLHHAGSPLNPPLPVQVRTEKGVELLTVTDLTRPIAGELQQARERYDRLERTLKERAPEAMQLLRQGPPESWDQREAILTALAQGSDKIPAGLYAQVCADPTDLPAALEALAGCGRDEQQALEFFRQCRADGDPVSGAARKLSETLGDYSSLARLAPGQLAAIEELSRLDRPTLELGSWGRGYADNSDTSIEFPTKLALTAGSRIEFEARYGLERDCDFVRLEARGADGQWVPLARYTGQDDWREHVVDLSRLPGQEVDLRLRLTSDSSQTGDGFAVRKLRVITDGKVRLTTDDGGATLAELVKLAPSEEDLRAIVQDAREAGLKPALALYGAGSTGLGSLVGQIGLTPALALKDVAANAAPALELARKLKPTAKEQLELARELAQKKVDPAPFAVLERSLRPPDWQAEGSWQVAETEAGRVWKHGTYPENANLALTTPEFVSGADAVLGYRVATELEDRCDFLHVEVRENGGEWRTLESHTGKSQPHDREHELPAGQRVQLRFRLSSDGSQSGQGVSLAAIRVVADGKRVLAFDEGSAGRGELAELARSGDAGRLEEVQRLHAQTGSVSAALTLAGRADGELAALIGVDSALRLGDIDRSAPEIAACWNAARALQSSFQHPVDLAEREVLTRRLATSDIALDQLARLAKPTPGVAWEPGAGWLQVREQDSLIWRRPYGENDQSALVSPPIDLTGVQGARALFEHRYDFEAGCDFMFFEAQREGDEAWTSLARYTGRGGGDEVVDLSAFDGQKIRLRYRLTSDGSQQGEGYRLGSVHGNGLTDLRPPAKLAQAVEVLADTPPDRREQALDDLERAATRLGSREAALALWPDLSEGRLKLAEGLGLGGGLGLAHQADQLLESFEVARRLCLENGEQADRKTLLALGEKLLKADLTPEQAGALGALAARKSTPWPAEGPWRAERGGYGFGRYGDNLDASLVFPKVSLKGLHDARIQLEMKHDLEQGCDFVRLEAKTGDTWEEVARWNGRADWTERDLDLSRFDGQDLELRLRLTTDGSQSGEGAGVRGVRIRARSGSEPLPRTLAQMPEGTASASDLIELVTSDPSVVEPLSAMSAALDSPAAATELWPAAARNPELITELALALGLGRARELADLVQSSADVPRVIELYESSWRLSMAMLASPPDAERLAMVRTLMPKEVRPEQVRSLLELLRANEAPVRGVQADPPWRRKHDSERGSIYSTGGYGDNASASLTLPPVKNAQKLRFEAAYDLETNCDFLIVEAKRNGEWAELARYDGRSDWKLHELSVAGDEEIRFRLLSDGSQSGQGIKLGLIEVGDFRLDPTPIRWGSLVDVLANGTLPTVETLARQERLAGALEIAALVTPDSDLEALRQTYRLSRTWGRAPRPECVPELMGESSPELNGRLAQLPPPNAWRVLEFIREKQAGPLAGVTLEQALDSYLAVAVNQVLVEDLDKVLEMMLARNAASVGERDSSVIVGGVVVPKKKA